MKKLIFLCLMFAASQATLADALVVVAEAENGLFKVKYRADRTCDTRMVIRDEHGNRIFSEVIKNQCSFIRPYNFSRLPYGRYTIIATNAYSEKTTYVDHQPKPEPVIVYRATRLKDGRYLLQIPKSPYSRLLITISGSEGRLYSSVIKPEGDFACLYKLQNTQAFDPIRFHVQAVR